MVTFSQRVMSDPVPQGSLRVYFAGQAGFILKTHEGRLYGIDLYLSDCCARSAHFKRLMPKIMSPDDIVFDAVLITHEHPDHFDSDAVPFLMQNGKTRLYTNLPGKALCESMGITERVTGMVRGETYQEEELKIEAVYCDHGELAPDALGLILTVSGKTLYIAGDTAYRPEMISDIAARNIDLMGVPINGAFGNLNEEQAAGYAGLVKPALTVPYHYWNFAEHRGDPYLFMQAMENSNPGLKYNVMAMGESILI